jgi:hypothetical protein
VGISGNLKTMQLSELLQWLALGQKTGSLLIEGHGVEKRLYFQNGRINFTSSSDQREYLGQFLVSHGYITEDELKKAMEVQEESKILLGRILLMINAISETDLLRLMRRKAEESIFDVFLWDDGNFEFIDGEQPDLKMVPLSLDLTSIILEGLHRYDEWKRIRERVPDATVVPTLVRPINLENLADRERLMVHQIDGQRSIEEIALQTHSAEFAVSRFIFECLSDGSVALAQSVVRRRKVAATSGGSTDTDVEHFLQRGQASMKEDPQAAYRMFKVARDLDPADGRAAEAVRDAEREIRGALERDSVTGEKIPELALSIPELTERTFSPHEGFVLSRINGQWDVKSIAKISPIKELDVLMIFQRLWKDGVIRWKKKV